jgi:hypothetical protein
MSECNIFSYVTQQNLLTIFSENLKSNSSHPNYHQFDYIGVWNINFCLEWDAAFGWLGFDGHRMGAS